MITVIDFIKTGLSKFRKHIRNYLDLFVDTGRFLALIDVLLLVIHIILEFLYVGFGMRSMIWVNVGSIAVYLLVIAALQDVFYEAVFIAYFIEITFHVVIATTQVGWGGAFWLWLIAILVCAFYPNYAGDDFRKFGKFSYIASALIAAVYFVMFILMLSGNIPLVGKGLTVDRMLAFTGVNSLISIPAILLFISLFSERVVRADKDTRWQAKHDQLTKLYNRFALHNIMDGVVEKANDEEMTFSVAIADIDFFKKVNDIYGHDAGDAVLKALADKMLAHSDEKKIVGRWGGEEFLFICATEEARAVMRNELEDFRREIEAMTVDYQGTPIKITISAGVADFFPGDNIDEVITKADHNLYEAKATGRNKVVS
ncbi:MAG: GGDEF domain-containing protein [Catonella sp.]|nr:GGDEF domain-containing protein [Catonella sp.]